MSTLARIYDDKKNSDTDITTRKTYLLGVDELYVETNYNIRDIDQTHVEEFRDAFIAGEHVPPLAVKVTEKGIKVIDGHHRYYGAKLAQEAGFTLRLECKDFVGNEADSVAFMVTSSQGRALLPLERAAAYQRLVNQGLEPAEIAAKVKRSNTDVEQHLQLLTVGEPLIEMVKSGEVAATTAVALQREHGVKASSVAQEQMQKAKAAGKKKLTKTDAMPQFSAAQARKLAELIAKHCQTEQSEEGARITLTFETDLQAAELMDIILLAKEHYGIPNMMPAYAIDAPIDAKDGSSRPTLSLSALLKAHSIRMNASQAYRQLEKLGIVEHKSRASRSGTDGVKLFWSLTAKGCMYGKNITSPANPRETQPHFFESKFAELLRLLETVH